MTRLVTLSGRVIDADGNPMSQGEVKLGSFKVPVAADGTFTIKDQVPGSYALTAIPSATRAPEGARVSVTTTAPETTPTEQASKAVSMARSRIRRG